MGSRGGGRRWKFLRRRSRPEIEVIGVRLVVLIKIRFWGVVEYLSAAVTGQSVVPELLEGSGEGSLVVAVGRGHSREGEEGDGRGEHSD
jgi:hypothetical protein